MSTQRDINRCVAIRIFQNLNLNFAGFKTKGTFELLIFALLDLPKLSVFVLGRVGPELLMSFKNS